MVSCLDTPEVNAAVKTMFQSLFRKLVGTVSNPEPRECATSACQTPKSRSNSAFRANHRHSLKALDPNRPIREATKVRCSKKANSITSSAATSTAVGTVRPRALAVFPFTVVWNLVGTEPADRRDFQRKERGSRRVRRAGAPLWDSWPDRIIERNLPKPARSHKVQKRLITGRGTADPQSAS